MLEFMREGGMMMWVLVVAALAAGVLAAFRPARSRVWVLASGSVSCLILGVVGMCLGMAAVSQKYTMFPDKVAAVAQGIGELANNGVLGGGLAALLGAAALVARIRAPGASS